MKSKMARCFPINFRFPGDICKFFIFQILKARKRTLFSGILNLLKIEPPIIETYFLKGLLHSHIKGNCLRFFFTKDIWVEQNS